MTNSIREILLLYSTIETQLRAARGYPITTHDIRANPDLAGEPKWRVIDCLRQLNKKKIIIRVDVADRGRERYGYIHRDYLEKAISPSPTREFLSAKEAELAAQVQGLTQHEQKEQISDTVRLKVNKDKSVTVTIGQVRITIEVEENKND